MKTVVKVIQGTPDMVNRSFEVDVTTLTVVDPHSKQLSFKVCYFIANGDYAGLELNPSHIKELKS